MAGRGLSCATVDARRSRSKAIVRPKSMIGPFPSIATMPSTMDKLGRIVAVRSMIDCSMPLKCSRFFGHPYTAPGTVPKRFFMGARAWAPPHRHDADVRTRAAFHIGTRRSIR